MLSREEIEKLKNGLEELKDGEGKARAHHESRGGKKEESKTTTIGVYTQIGFEFFTYLIVFAFGGYFLDAKLGTSPWFFLSGTFAGFGFGLFRIIKATRSLE